jgi:hypothetical protein
MAKTKVRAKSAARKSAKITASSKARGPRKTAKSGARKASASSGIAKIKRQWLDLRYPYTGYRYRAEGPDRIRVDRGNMWGYFDRNGVWLEGPLQSAEGPFCRYMSSAWTIAERRGFVRSSK